MKNHSSSRAVLLLCLLTGSGSASEKQPPAPEGARLFVEEIRPLLLSKCVSCHGGEKLRGGLDLRQRRTAVQGGDSGPGLVPGAAERSLLHQRVAAREMPPGNPLSPEQIEVLRRWIQSGAPYVEEPLVYQPRRAGRDWWSLQPIRRPSIPSPTGKHRPHNPVDAFILQELGERGLTPSPWADRRTLIRRVTVDLTGLPPTPEEVEHFVADRAPDAYEKLVDRLLASPAYGERFGRHWLDVVRFAESHGYETNALRMTAWPYRDYVIRAFNRDIAYPQFILEQLAGDTLNDADWLTQAATGFLVGGAHDVVGNQTEAGMLQQRADDLDDILTATGATFLGLTVNCARCHDHKFDPISQKDYYSLQAILAGVQHTERALQAPSRSPEELAAVQAQLVQVERQLDLLEPESRQARRIPVHTSRNVERFAPVEARYLRFTIHATNNGIEPCLDELEIYSAGDKPRNVALATHGTKASASSVYPNSPIHRLEHINDGQHGNSRSWISNEPGKGWVQLEFPRVEKIERIVWGRDREERFRDRLATQYVIEVATEPGRWQTVANGGTRQAHSPEASRQAPALPTADKARYDDLEQQRRALLARVAEFSAQLSVYAGTFTQPGVTHLLMRGDPMRKGEAVAPGSLAVLRPSLELAADSPEKERRLALARWLGRPENPLTARVLVNRVWQYHFGQGIVNTPSDFGFNGDKPSHPELLDWLASEFMQQGWRLKPLHRLLVTSATYQQASLSRPEALAVDRNNRLLWRMTPRRLEAEAIRDAMLQATGKLDRRMGGPGYHLWEKNTNYVTVFTPKSQLGADEFRRMIYQFKPRSQQDPLFGVFDCPDASLARPQRTSSTTVLQSLNLFNSTFVLAQADMLAERTKQEVGAEPQRQVEQVFRRTLGRLPTETERRAATQVIVEQGLPTLCRVLFNTNEFLYVD